MSLSYEERIHVRSEINRIKRAELDKLKRPGKKMGRPGKMNEQQIQSAHRLYMTSSLQAVAEQIWKRYGYDSVEACRVSIYKAFKKRGLAIHPTGRKGIPNGARAQRPMNGEP